MRTNIKILKRKKPRLTKADKQTKANRITAPFGVYTPENAVPRANAWQGWKKRICICVPVTGSVRIEWMMARFGQVVPVNWSNGDIFQYFDTYAPLGYAVADARNYCVQYSVTQGFEWTLFIDHDVILPPNIFLKITEYMRTAKYPVICGLYYCKGSHPEPLLFRGRGNSYFGKWKRGEKVWVDGIPMGLTLIHNSILELMWKESEQYAMPIVGGSQVVRKVFETPRHAWQDPESGQYHTKTGTEDLFWCDRIRSQKVFARSGWKKFQKMKYPYLVDTSMFCQHIDESGIQYPANVGIV